MPYADRQRRTEVANLQKQRYAAAGLKGRYLYLSDNTLALIRALGDSPQARDQRLQEVLQEVLKESIDRGR